MTAATTQAKAPRRPLRLQAIALACLVAAVAVITVERTWLALALPLWFDESFTAAVAATPNWRSFVQEAYNDVAAPLYYALMRLWEGLAGPSDFALRAPALLAVLAAGAIPIASRIKGLSFEARVTWGAMIFGWWGVGVLLNGRCYALLLAVSTLQCVLFARLLLVPSRRVKGFWDLPEPFETVRLGASVGSFGHSITASRYRFEVREARAAKIPAGAIWWDLKSKINVSTATKKALQCLQSSRG